MISTSRSVMYKGGKTMSSDIRDTILAVVDEWPAYHALKTVESSHSAHKLVSEKFPTELEKVLPVDPKLIFEGSTGRGNITSSPWVATFDRRITTSATRGFYQVYLFSTDLRRLYLSIGMGTTQFTDYYGYNKAALDKIEAAASTLSSIHTKKFPSSWQLGRRDISAQSNQRLHRAYERSVIASVDYDLADLPTEETLVSDYLDIIRVYQEIVESPLTPEISELLEESIEKPEANELEPTVSTFVPRPKKKSKGGKGGGGSRHSKESKKVGDAGEKAVVVYEQKKLRSCDLENFVEKIVWEADEGNTPGWDISSFDESGEPICIEVKSSKGATISSVDVTDNEWKAAQAEGERYKIYIVTKALSEAPKIEILGNPFQYVEEDTLDFKPILFRLSLSEG